MTDTWQLCEHETGRVVVEHLELADTFWRRFRGLQFRRPLAANAGLLIAPCNSIHTCWLRFAIDVAFLDEAGVVLAVRTNVRPWRVIAPIRSAKTVLETTAGCVTIRPGMKLRLAKPRCDDALE